MEPADRDSTGDWRLPAASRPPLVGELEARIDEALATARAAESAVMTVGAAALDAAEQARRAADLAERASAALGAAPPEAGPDLPAAPVGTDDGGMSGFAARADRLQARLRELERRPAPLGS